MLEQERVLFLLKITCGMASECVGGGGDGATNPGQESEQPQGNPSLLEPHATARAPPSVPGVQDHPPPPEIYSPKAMFDGAQVPWGSNSPLPKFQQ